MVQLEAVLRRAPMTGDADERALRVAMLAVACSRQAPSPKQYCEHFFAVLNVPPNAEVVADCTEMMNEMRTQAPAEYRCLLHCVAARPKWPAAARAMGVYTTQSMCEATCPTRGGNRPPR